MSRNAGLRLPLTLALMFTLGAASVRSAPASVHFGSMWPTGLAAGALLLSPRVLAPYATAAVGALAALSFLVGGYPVEVSIGYGLGVTIEAVITHRVLTSGWTRRVQLRNPGDFGRFMLACGAGALAGAVVFTVVSALASFGTPWKVGLATFGTHAAGLVVLLGIFMEATPHLGDYGPKERVAAWLNSLVVTTGAFIPREVPSLTFLAVPGLGWVALRAPMREAMVQLLTVSVIAGTMTSAGLGPFADPFLTRNLDPELTLLPLQAFLVTCAMVTIPFSMAAGAQRRSAAEALMERARSDRLVQSARGIAIIGTDEVGRINLFSPGAELILGYTAEEVFGYPTRMFHTQAEIARQAESLGCPSAYIDVVRATVELPPGTAREWEFMRKDGASRWLSLILSPITDENDGLMGYVATADDVTDRHDTQAALEAALMSEREAVERLTEIDQVKDRFVSSVSHELRTPITNIVGYLELLMDGVYGQPSHDQARAMTRIELNSRRLLTLIDDLLTLSRMDSSAHAELTPVDLVAVVRRAEEIVRPGLMRRDLKLELEVPDHEVVIDGDSGQLERLVINLATNAVKFTLDGGVVTMRVQRPANGTGPAIEVEDTGIGIPEADQEMLFSRFFRATQARGAAVPGSGLGLSIAKSIAEAHGGQISATSVFGSGSTFRVEFPASSSADKPQR